MNLSKIISDCKEGNTVYTLAEKTVGDVKVRGFMHSRFDQAKDAIRARNSSMIAKWEHEDKTKKAAENLAKRIEEQARADEKKRKKIEAANAKREEEAKILENEKEKRSRQQEVSRARNLEITEETKSKAAAQKQREKEAQEKMLLQLAEAENKAVLGKLELDEKNARSTLFHAMENSLLGLFYCDESFKVSLIVKKYIAVFAKHGDTLKHSLSVLEQVLPENFHCKLFVGFFSVFLKFHEELCAEDLGNAYAAVSALHYYIFNTVHYIDTQLADVLVPALMEAGEFSTRSEPFYDAAISFLDLLIVVCEPSAPPVFKKILAIYPEFAQAMYLFSKISIFLNGKSISVSEMIGMGSVEAQNIWNFKKAIEEATNILFKLLYNPQRSKCNSLSQIVKMDPDTYTAFVEAFKKVSDAFSPIALHYKGDITLKSENWEAELRNGVTRLSSFVQPSKPKGAPLRMLTKK